MSEHIVGLPLDQEEGDNNGGRFSDFSNVLTFLDALGNALFIETWFDSDGPGREADSLPL